MWQVQEAITHVPEKRGEFVHHTVFGREKEEVFGKGMKKKRAILFTIVTTRDVARSSLPPPVVG